MTSDGITVRGVATLAAIMASCGPRANNFDAIRLGAALLVVVSHAFMVVAGGEAAEPLYRLTGGQMTLGVLGVTVFFFVSGMLITASFVKEPNVEAFARKRALRLLPALGVLCLLTALVLGPLLTSRSIVQYFADPATWRYLLNAALVLPVQYGLPGVFESVPMARLVNGSLWTLWYEVACYAIVVALGVTGMLRGPVVALLWLASFALPIVLGGHEQNTGVLYRLLQCAELFRYFGAGMLCFLYADRIPAAFFDFRAALVIVVLAIFTPIFAPVLALAMPVLVLTAAYQPSPLAHRLTASGDLSYGVYLYAFPLQQLVMQWLVPVQATWWANLALTLPPTLLCAWASWRLVERPALKWKAMSIPGWRVSTT